MQGKLSKEIFELIEPERQPMKETEEEKEDGLRYCTVCELPTECYQMECIFPIACRCVLERVEAEEEAERQRKKLERIERNRRNSGLSKKQLSVSFENIETGGVNIEAYRNAYRYMLNFEKECGKVGNLVLLGGVGTGKTTVTYAISNYLLDKGFSVFFAKVYDIINRRFGYEYEAENERFERLTKRANLLIIDDIGAERSTEFAKEKLLELIDYRLGHGRPVIYTTNLTRQQLSNAKDVTDLRIYDRLKENSRPIELKGESFRAINERWS